MASAVVDVILGAQGQKGKDAAESGKAKTPFKESNSSVLKVAT